MDFKSFIGHKKTDGVFLNRIKSISESKDQVLDSLRRLNIFKTITPLRNKIAVEEMANSIKMNMDSGKNKSFVVSLPNLFGSGEFVNFEYRSEKNCKMDIGAPRILGKNIYYNSMSLSKGKCEYNQVEVDKYTGEISTRVKQSGLAGGIEKIGKLLVFYGKVNTNMLGFGVSAKAGVTKTDRKIPFAKYVVDRAFGLTVGSLFVDSRMSFGGIFGQTNLTERFFLGARIRGYKDNCISPMKQNKRIGGSTFIEIRNRVGVVVKNIELFAFGDLGIASVNGLANCFREMVRLEDSNCVGRSVGVGMSLRDNKGVSLAYSVPLTSSTDVEKYSLSLNMDF